MSNNVVMYSYKKSKYDHINEHEKKRLRHSISSLRENSSDVPIYLFSDDPSMFLKTFDVWHDVNILPFCEGFDPEIPSAWSIQGGIIFRSLKRILEYCMWIQTPFFIPT